MNTKRKKKCPACEGVYPLDSFYVNKKGVAGSYCKPCSRTKAREWTERNKRRQQDNIRNWHKSSYRANSRYRLKMQVASGVWKVLTGERKTSGVFTHLPYTASQLRERLSVTMPTGYTWEDYYAGRLQIDHIKPVSSFSFESPVDAEFLECWALKNLQLLTVESNKKKGRKTLPK